ncbi:unnamed protein product [Trichogramma brassicae]|uniref:Reverse transcriptase domain-containing protein n=1 Tax=Trichogramma brassicae TaxID=86971 RepID=A0A6H5I9U5_9HYME|nr:unnamed protein product [Trichogramma brassicae]
MDCVGSARSPRRRRATPRPARGARVNGGSRDASCLIQRTAGSSSATCPGSVLAGRGEGMLARTDRRLGLTARPRDASETKGDKVEEMQGGGVGSLKDPKVVLQQQKLPKNQKAATERERELRMRQLAATGKKGKGKGKNARDRSPLSSEVSATDGGDDSKVSEMEVGHESEEDETRERDEIRRKKKRRKTRSGSGSVGSKGDASGPFQEKRPPISGCDPSRACRGTRIRGICGKKTIDEKVDVLNEWVTSACDEHLEKKRRLKGRLKWWTRELETKKREVRRLRKEWQRMNARRMDEERMHDKRREYRMCLREYKDMMAERKRNDWRMYVNEQGNKDPWGSVYKIIRGKRVNRGLASLREGDVVTRNWSESADLLLEKFFPGDNENNEWRMNVVIRENENEWTEMREDEIDGAVRRMKRRKASGLDGIMNEVIEIVWAAIPGFVWSLMDACLVEGCYRMPGKGQGGRGDEHPRRPRKRALKRPRPRQLSSDGVTPAPEAATQGQNAPNNRLVILQINAAHAREVNHEIRLKAVETGIQVAAIQEPYCQKDLLPGMGLHVSSVFEKQYHNKKTGAAISCFTKDITMLKLTELCEHNVSCVELTGSFGTFILVSVYCKFSRKTAEFITHLDKIMRMRNGREILICGDLNAKSPMWGSPCSDENGILFEEFLANNGLVVLNDNRGVPTFRSSNGSSNIDATFATSGIARKLELWRTEEWSQSDHRPIRIVLNFDANPEPPRKKPRYKISKADWGAFTKTLLDSKAEITTAITSEPMDVDNVDAINKTITDTIIVACDNSMPKSTSKYKAQTWWTSKLSSLKKRTQSLRSEYEHQLKRHSSSQSIAAAKREYMAKKREYLTEIRKAKRASWRRFVTKESSKNVWGLPYKIAAGRVKPTKPLASLRKNDGTMTRSWQETAQALLKALVPDDTSDVGLQADQRIAAESTSLDGLGEDAPDCTTLEVLEAIKRNSSGKSPGLDGILPEVLKRALVILPEITSLFNKCLALGRFPKEWKKGNLIPIPKPDKDETLAKSYRPICLLPLLGKTFERLIIDRASAVIHKEGLESDSQFGFRVGRSTEDAILKLRQVVEESNSNYACAIPLDISGAFDNLWWPSLTNILRARECPKNIFRVLKDYLHDREVIIQGTHQECSKKVTKGTPQGSIFGPIAWNLQLDGLLNLIKGEGVPSVAYADDVIIVILGDSRRELEARADHILKLVHKWCLENKLAISVPKSGKIMLKGKLEGRLPTARLDGQSLKSLNPVKYLGLYVGEELSFAEHASRIANESATRFHEVTRFSKANWGLRFNNLSTLYDCVFLPKITYAAAAWADKSGSSKRLRTAQRSALLGLTKAYRTTSHSALHVLAGKMPMELKLKQRAAEYRIRKGASVSVEGLDMTSEEVCANKASASERVRRRLIEIWQAKWNSSEKGKETFAFFPNIARRLSYNLELDHYVTQLLTGHGNFAYYKFIYCKASSHLCACGETEDADHVLFDCPLRRSQRWALVEAAKVETGSWPCTKERLVANKVLFGELKKFARRALDSRSSNTMRGGRRREPRRDSRRRREGEGSQQPTLPSVVPTPPSVETRQQRRARSATDLETLEESGGQ